MKSSGLRVLTIFRAFANQSGGFEMVGFDVKDIYNAIEKQRKAEASDTYNALKYLQMLKSRDPLFSEMYVMGFDATSGRNKYKCPLVIFSGVDYHMRTGVFGCAVFSKEWEKSYVWLLRAFLEAMKGKAPKSVIIDVEEFGLQQNSWDKDMYEKKHMWSNAHIRGKFFAGLKTTSRCEALNM
ncbi:hypothetical protein AHAS_Ahas11G0254300 [Arachis hypogaea]